MCTSDVFLALLAILFPPIAVWVKSGICSADSFINIALCCLGFVPGLIHAWYIIARYPESDYEPVGGADGGADGGENGRVTYYYVSGQGQGGQALPAQTPQGQWQGQQQRGYGTVQAPQAGPAGGSSGGEGVPPSYEDAVKGDNKVQT